MSQNLSSAAVVISALRAKLVKEGLIVTLQRPACFPAIAKWPPLSEF